MREIACCYNLTILAAQSQRPLVSHSTLILRVISIIFANLNLIIFQVQIAALREVELRNMADGEDRQDSTRTYVLDCHDATLDMSHWTRLEDLPCSAVHWT